MNRGKQYKQYAESLNQTTDLTIQEAVSIIKEKSFAKFDETIEVAFKLGIDPRQADQALRGTLSLPHGTGKDVRVVVICGDSDIKAAEEAGANEVGSDELVDRISKGFLDFDIVIATPAMMGKVGKLGKLLGARGMMPSPKSGTVTQDVAKTVSEFKAGKVEYRNDKTGIVHIAIERLLFRKKILLKISVKYMTLSKKVKPQKAKGTYIQSLVVSSTMSPDYDFVLRIHLRRRDNMVPTEKVLSKKAEIISEIETRVEGSAGVYLFDYRGLTVSKLSELRTQLREANAKATVFKNTFIKRALDELDYSYSDTLLKEPTVLLTCENDIVSPAKVLVDFVKNNEIGTIKGGYLGSKTLDLKDIKSLSNLPSREELLAKFVGSINAPVSNFVMGLSGVSRSLVYVLSAIKSEKDGGN